MSKLEMSVSVSIEKETGRVLAVYFQIRKGQAVKVREFANGNAFANYSATGKLLGIELLGPCEIKVLDQIAQNEPNAKKFVRGAIPRSMALAS